MARQSVILELIAWFAESVPLYCSGQETQAEASTLRDYPPQDDHGIPEPDRRKNSHNSPHATAIELTDDGVEQKTQPIPIPVRRAPENMPRRKRGGRHVRWAQDIEVPITPIAKRVASNKQRAGKDSNPRGINGADEDEYDEYDDDNNSDVIMESHPLLENYPGLDENTFRERMEFEGPLPQGRSLITEKLPAYTRKVEKDRRFSRGLQGALELQRRVAQSSMDKLRRLAAEGGKTRISVSMGEGPAERWEIEPSATF
ncbi:hypothetical protein F5Y01DRAFT_327622 [Xylaria sp. FL0043]|nr:hypothetical protein F5Y01DRAFT_327622 [Xylaria sp. FL0043]